MLPGWEESKGAKAEFAYARSIGMVVFDGDSLPLTPSKEEEGDSTSATPCLGCYRRAYSTGGIVERSGFYCRTGLWDMRGSQAGAGFSIRGKCPSRFVVKEA
ncbi:MAG: DUF4406 domain-containing protein, partial [Desulfurivibrionaceae bacterium]|nr:DUF4406 domain-containing protein [Desulfurivibrionaceae bacterium]